MFRVEQRRFGLTLEDVSGAEDDALAALLTTDGNASLAGRGSLSHHHVSECGTLLERVSLAPYLGVADVSTFAKCQGEVVVNLASQFVGQVTLLH